MLTHLLKYAECNVCVLNEIRHLRNWCDLFACVLKKVANWYSDHQLLVGVRPKLGVWFRLKLDTEIKGNYVTFFLHACSKKVANWYSDPQMLLVYDRIQSFNLGSNPIPKLMVKF